MLKLTKKEFIKKFAPFLLTILIVALDQGTKSYIINHFPNPSGEVIFDVFNNGLVYITHVRNDVIAFSLGSGVPAPVRPLLFIVLPILVLCFLLFYYFKSNEWTVLQRWALAGILGGGAGNIIDRIFPPGGKTGVVDFISVKFFGIFGMERWPTFNVADASVVICVLLWLFSIFINPSGAANAKSGGKKKVPEKG